MDQPFGASRPFGPRLLIAAVLTGVLTIGLGVASHLTHSATIPNVGLPASNSKQIPNLDIYDPQVSVVDTYLTDLARLDYAGAYQQLAPSRRSAQSEAQFEADQKQYGQLGQPSVWIDDENTARAEYVLAKPDGSAVTARHRFALQNEQGKWWVDREVPAPGNSGPAPSLSVALRNFVLQRAGAVWATSLETLRQEPFEGGQLMLFSYIEPHPPHVLVPERIAVLAYYVNRSGGWRLDGGPEGDVAGMSMADVALGFTAFGDDRRYVAYYGVVENANASTLTFSEPNGVRHTLNVKGQKTVLVINERNLYEPVPLTQPFKSIQAKDIYGNTLRTNPPSPGDGNGIGG